jgi:tetratricopeptide (TPR) repeat protein
MPLMAVMVLMLGAAVAADAATPRPEKLLRAGLELSEKTHYLEALDLLEEARDTLEAERVTQTALYGDVLYALAETRIKGRLHQSFPAQYVKFALKEVQLANKVRERLHDLPPRKFAEGFFVEGYIQKKFFKRISEAIACLEKAVSIDPGFAAAKRELGELVLSKEPQKGEH